MGVLPEFEALLLQRDGLPAAAALRPTLAVAADLAGAGSAGLHTALWE